MKKRKNHQLNLQNLKYNNNRKNNLYLKKNNKIFRNKKKKECLIKI